MNTRAFTALVGKDLLLFLSDRRAVLLSFVVPLTLASIFTSISTDPGGGGGGANGGGRAAIPVLVADGDGGAVSRAAVEGLAGDGAAAVTETTAEAARAGVLAGAAGVALVIPQGFGAGVGRGLFRADAAGRPELTVVTDPTHAAEAALVRGLFTRYALEAVGRDPGAGLPPAARQALRRLSPGGAGAGFAPPFTVREESVAPRGLTDRGVMAAHAFAGMAVQFVLFASVEAGVGLLTERQKGLWRRVRAAPVSKLTLLGSKAASQAVIALVILAVLFGFGAAAFGVRFEGGLPGFALVAAAYALAASTFGLLIAALGKTPQAARGISVLAVLLMVLLGGAWMPMFLFPRWLQTATLVMPTRWAVDGLEGATWRGLSFAALAAKAGVLLGFAALFGLLAAARFRWEED